MKRILILPVLLFICCNVNGQQSLKLPATVAALSSAGRTDEAVTMLNSEIVRASAPELLNLRGELFLKQRMLKEAGEDFMKAESLSQGSGSYGLARCAALSGDALAATAWLERYLRSPRKKSEPEILLDDAFASITRSSEWKALWKKEWYKGYERMEWEIKNALSNGRSDLASEVFAGLAAMYPEMPVTEYCKALIAISAGNFDAALKTLTPLDQDDTDYMLARAVACEGAGDFFTAASLYSRLIDKGSSDHSMLLRRAEMLYRSGDIKTAITEVEYYLSLLPDDFRALSLLGRSHAADGSIFEALPYLNRNIEKHPDQPLAYSLRGDAWLASRTWDKAAEDYAMSLDLEPKNASVNLNLGISLINAGRAEDACHYLRLARDLGEKSAVQYLSRYCLK